MSRINNHILEYCQGRGYLGCIRKQIGDYIFVLVGKDTKSDYKKVHYISFSVNSPYDRFHCMAYTSKSEGGIWRFCLMVDEVLVPGMNPWKGLYCKGNDYITSTCLSFELQDYINRYNDKLQEEEKNISEIFGNTSGYKHVNDEKGYKNRAIEIFNYINDDSRIVDDELIFKILDKCSAGVCFSTSGKENIMDLLLGILKNIEDIIPKDKLNIFANKITKTSKQLKDESFEELIPKLYTLMSDIMEYNFDLTDDMPTKISKEPYIYKYDDNVTFVHNFYSIKIQSKKTKKKYNVVYSRYLYFDKKRTELTKYYFIILNIIPEIAKITKYGLFDKIVSAGVYIYKPMDYDSQLNLLPNSDIMITKLKDKTYYFFIGDYLTSLFPLNRERVKKYNYEKK